MRSHCRRESLSGSSGREERGPHQPFSAGSSPDRVRRRATEALLAAAQLSIQATADREVVAETDTISVVVTVANHGTLPVTVTDVAVSGSIMRMPGPEGKVMHGELRIGDSVIFVSDEFPGMSCAPTPGATNPVYIFMYTENVNAIYNRAVAAGAKVDMPLMDQFWGDRYGKVTDPFGHQWGLAQHVEDVAPEDMKRRQKEAMAAQTAKAAGGN